MLCLSSRRRFSLTPEGVEQPLARGGFGSAAAARDWVPAAKGVLETAAEGGEWGGSACFGAPTPPALRRRVGALDSGGGHLRARQPSRPCYQAWRRGRRDSTKLRHPGARTRVFARQSTSKLGSAANTRSLRGPQPCSSASTTCGASYSDQKPKHVILLRLRDILTLGMFSRMLTSKVCPQRLRFRCAEAILPRPADIITLVSFILVHTWLWAMERPTQAAVGDGRLTNNTQQLLLQSCWFGESYSRVFFSPSRVDPFFLRRRRWSSGKRGKAFRSCWSAYASNSRLSGANLRVE